ncbi:MAG: extracellular solute-binding protein [Gaiellaceae bacterium]|jgi:multiple sugar transport system substrate-binding protein
MSIFRRESQKSAAGSARRRLTSRLATGAAALTLVGALATIAATQATPAATQKKSAVVHLTWWTMWSGATLKMVNQMVTQFNNTHPGIHVTATAIPSAATTSTAKLLSSITAGDPPDVFTEWWPEIGSFAAHNDLIAMDSYLTGTYSKFKKWEYPVAVQGGTYKGSLYAVPMSLNSWALYYNKNLMAKYGITSPPKTLKALDADQAKMWVTKNGQVSQLGFFPYTNENGFQFYTTFFGATNCFNMAGKYDFEHSKGAKAEMNWIARYAHYSYSQVMALQTALGQVAGGQTDIWTAGKSGFVLTGPWEGAMEIPASNPGLAGHFGVEAFPGIVGGPSTIGQGNFNIIPKGSKHPAQAFQFIAWLAGYHNESFSASIDTKGGWVPAGPSITKQPAYVKWITSNPWMKGFLPQMTSKYTQAPALTPTQAQLFDAENTATANVLQKIMTPTQALQYIDKQANKG